MFTNSVLAEPPVSIISSGNVKVNTDFMWIMSMLKKVTPTKSSIASEMCH